MNKRSALFQKILICFSFLLLLLQEVNAQTLTKKQQDSAFLIHPGQERRKLYSRVGKKNNI